LLDDMYRVCRHGSLDDLMESRDKCLLLILRCRREDAPPPVRSYLNTAKRQIRYYNREILRRRARGERTVSEELSRITGNTFVVLKAW
jgi:hypothetical protein